MHPGSNRPNILILGVNHKTADVGIRERLALKAHPSPLALFLNRLGKETELVFLSTCNRVEVIAATDRTDESAAVVQDLWCSETGIARDTLSSVLYVHKGDEAIRHVFRVASSLDSMVVGEPQILGQLKDAYRNACEAKTTGPILNRLLTKAFSVAKLVRTETNIAGHAVSISYAAVELARKIFGDLAGKHALLIGAGEMAELAAQHLLAAGTGKIVVANRTLSRAVELAQTLKGSAIALEELDEALVDADIVISSTGAPGLVLHKEQVQRIMRPRRHRLLFLIDIAVPRDIDPGVNDIDNVYLYDIDDLKGVVDANKTERAKEALKAERMIETEVIKFLAWMETLDVVPVIQGLQDKVEAIRLREIERTAPRLSGLTPDQMKAIDVLTRSIVQKILHDPIVHLRKHARDEDIRPLLDSACRLFGLNGAMGDEKRPAEKAGLCREKKG
ncbi:MAG: glutamyl-tRNA reductase [Deltaproteobacteria bacterium]